MAQKESEYRESRYEKEKWQNISFSKKKKKVDMKLSGIKKLQYTYFYFVLNM